MVVCASQPSFRECLKPCAYRAARYRWLKCLLGVGAMVARQVHALVGPPRGFSATHELLPHPDPGGWRRPVRPGHSSHLLHQVFRAPCAHAAPACGHLASAGRGRGRLWLLGDGAHAVHVLHQRQAGSHGLPGLAQFHRAAVCVCDHGDRRHPAHPGAVWGPCPGACRLVAGAARHGHVLCGAGVRAPARVVHYRTGGHDAGRADAAGHAVLPPHLQPAQVFDHRRAVRKPYPLVERSRPLRRRPC